MSIAEVAPPRQISVTDCLSLVAAECGVTVLDLRSERKDRRVARPRQIAMWLARHATEYSLPRIAAAIGNRDHTTVLHGVRQIDGLREIDPSMRDLSDRLLRRLLADPSRDDWGYKNG